MTNKAKGWRDMYIKVQDLRQRIKELEEEVQEQQNLLQTQNKIISDLKYSPAVSIVMLSRFDEASEKATENIMYRDQEHILVHRTIQNIREALASQKISGA